jgi:nucleotidyltransferase/DNA polymerase involved in DNA repair
LAATQVRATERKSVDWEAIEREYRAGQLTVVEIGRQHGLSRTAINKRAKRDGWTRNLADRVRKEVSARLISEVSPEAERGPPSSLRWRVASKSFSPWARASWKIRPSSFRAYIDATA